MTARDPHYFTNRRLERLAARLCTECAVPLPAGDPRQKCAPHRAIDAKKSRAYKAAAKAAGTKRPVTTGKAAAFSATKAEITERLGDLFREIGLQRLSRTPGREPGGRARLCRPSP